MDVLKIIWSYMNTGLFTLGSSQITLWTVFMVSILSFLLSFLTKKIQKWMVYSLFSKSPIELGVRDAAASIARYLIMTIGFIVILQTMGVDLSSLTILFGALGVGIGFGLQNITNNFVSGLVILFERPIKLGDRIEIGTVRGDVRKISIRATTVRTNDNISIIVPNSEFVSSTVINWSHTDRNIRFNIPVGVSYREDPAVVRRVLIDVAQGNSGVLKDPPPDVLFDSYGDSAINFNLRIWSSSYIDKPNVLRSILYYEIFAAFKREGIQIPYPQRDIHIKDMPAARTLNESS